jgi:hypothetical protein
MDQSRERAAQVNEHIWIQQFTIYIYIFFEEHRWIFRLDDIKIKKKKDCLITVPE